MHNCYLNSLTILSGGTCYPTNDFHNFGEYYKINIASSFSYTKMSSTRVKSPGWAAFNLKHRQKQGLEPQIDKDPYPPIPSTLTSLCNCESMTRNNDLRMRPFSSVILPSVDFPTLTENKDVQKHVRNCDFVPRGKHGNNVIEENDHDLALKKLKALHSWADDSLIKDIMAAVDNNIEKALNLLSRMVYSSSSSSTGENEETKIAEPSSAVDDSQCHVKTGECFSLKDVTSEDSVEDNRLNLTDVHACGGKSLSNNAGDIKLILERLSSLPVEPEWEEDDIYLVHRKDALKMMRSASHHSKAANNAFLRGDHFSAQQHSLKARKEWLVAERLNSKAAKEILSNWNSENDMWKLDLHGLHAKEAVEALQERLQKIEMHPPMNCFASPNRFKAKNGMVYNSSLEPFSCVDTEDKDKQHASFSQIQKSLQVITGVGSHSRGQATLPTAVKSFLSENGYRIEEARPGVITVRPKIRPGWIFSKMNLAFADCDFAS